MDLSVHKAIVRGESGFPVRCPISFYFLFLKFSERTELQWSAKNNSMTLALLFLLRAAKGKGVILGFATELLVSASRI